MKNKILKIIPVLTCLVSMITACSPLASSAMSEVTNPTLTITPGVTYTPIITTTPTVIETPAKNGRITEADWNGIHITFVKVDVSATRKSLDPNSSWESTWADGEKTANIYFLSSEKGVKSDGYISKYTTYFRVVFSNGIEEIVREGLGGEQGLVGIAYSDHENTLGYFCISYQIPKEGMRLIKMEIARDKSENDRMTVIYQE
jgi:hypothetical protein